MTGEGKRSRGRFTSALNIDGTIFSSLDLTIDAFFLKSNGSTGFLISLLMCNKRRGKTGNKFLQQKKVG
jgi:hypothetical protein